MNTEEFNNIRTVFDTQNQFRMLAPESVAKGVLQMCKDENNEQEQRQCAANMMDLIQESVPKRLMENVSKSGKKTSVETPLYNAFFSEAMIKEIWARYKEISVTTAHQKRMEKLKEFMSTYKPTISLGEALYRLSFYLIPSFNNLAKSTNCLINFARRILLDTQNNILVDSAIMIGGQGKSTVQTGLKRAVEKMGLSSSSCQLPTIRDGVSEVFVRNEVCVDEDSKFVGIDDEALNKIADKQQITIRGKYIKEWSARSVASVFVGTNFLPNDVNDRRYSVRMVDENFKLEQNFGKWDIPGIEGNLELSYPQVVDWTEEGWLNLFYYVNKYEIKKQSYVETSYDYSLLYQVRKALDAQGCNVADIGSLAKMIEQSSGEIFDWKTRQSYKNKLFKLANQLKLEIQGERKHNIYNTYDWTKALEIDEAIVENPLERIYCYFHNNDDFKIKD